MSVIDQRLVDNSPFSRDIFFPLSFFLFFPFERKTDEESSAWGKVGHLGSFQAFKETSWKSVTHQQPKLKTEATSPQISQFIIDYNKSLDISYSKYLDILPHIDIVPPESVTRCQTRLSKLLWGSSDLHLRRMMMMMIDDD